MNECISSHCRSLQLPPEEEFSFSEPFVLSNSKSACVIYCVGSACEELIEERASALGIKALTREKLSAYLV